jgi:hypothetical protein
MMGRQRLTPEPVQDPSSCAGRPAIDSSIILKVHFLFVVEEEILHVADKSLHTVKRV